MRTPAVRLGGGRRARGRRRARRRGRGPDGSLAAHLPDGVQLAVQPEPRGTGDAVLAAREHIDAEGEVVVLSGDVPLIGAALIAELASTLAIGGAAAALATMVLDDPSGYGRVVRNGDGRVERVVETKTPGDATDTELAIREVNAGVYAFAAAPLLDALGRLRPDNSQREYYLPDVLPILRAGGALVGARTVTDPGQLLGVNDRVELAAMRVQAQRRIHEHHLRAGVTIVDPASTLIDVEVTIAPDTIVEPSTFLRGRTSIGSGCTVGPLSTLIDADLGDGVRVVHSYLQSCAVRDGASVAPSPTCGPARCCTRVRARGRSSRSRTRALAPARRSPICPTSAMPTSARARTSGRPRSPPTMTAAASTARPSGATCARASTRPRRPGERGRRRPHRRRLGHHR